MKSPKLLYSLAFLIASVTALRSSYAADIKGFSAIKAVGDCGIKEDSAYEAINLETVYAFGHTVRTGRNSYLDLQFSEENILRLLARTKLAITENVKNPKLKILKLSEGSVKVSLDNFPADHKLEVETPSAICGAVGTRFVVSFEDEALESDVVASAGSRVHRFVCDQGELQVASRFTIDDQIVIGQSFAIDSVTAGSDMVAVVQEGLDNVYTDVTVNRGRLTFKYGGDDGTAFTVDANEGKQPARFQASLSKKDDGTTFVAFKMLKGFADFTFFGGEGQLARIKAGEGAVLVPRTSRAKSIVKGKAPSQVAEKQLKAAKSEGQEYAKLVDMENSGASKAAVKNQKKKVRSAAQNTNRAKNANEGKFGGAPVPGSRGGETEPTGPVSTPGNDAGPPPPDVIPDTPTHFR